MRRDTTEFRNRFLKWKNGELVYENGLVSASYQDGKESTTYSTTTLPEITVTAPRKYISGYDRNGNPVYTFDKTLSIGFDPTPRTVTKRELWANRNPNSSTYIDPIIKAAQLGIGIPLIATSPVVGEVISDTARDLVLHPLSNIIGAVSSVIGEKADKLFDITKTFNKLIPKLKLPEGSIGGFFGYPVGRFSSIAKNEDQNLYSFVKNIRNKNSFKRQYSYNSEPFEEGGFIGDYGKLPRKNLTERTLLVDDNGNVNIRAVTKIVKDFYKTNPNVINYKKIINNSGNLYEHTKAVIKSAQLAPLPKGYTRKLLVEAALLHDVGKTFGIDNHAGKALPIIKWIEKKHNVFFDNGVKNAVYHHMDGAANSIGERDPLTRALHFVDVARGGNLDKTFQQYPYLTYPTNNRLISQNLDKDAKWQLKNIINPILDRYGYKFTKEERKKYNLGEYKNGPQIPIDTDASTARNMVLDFIKKHRTSVRTSHYPQDKKSYENLLNLAAKTLGKSKSDVSLEDIFKISAEYIKEHGTHAGNMGLDEYIHNAELSEKTKGSKYLALWSSTRDETATHYAREDTGNPYSMDVVRMKINDKPEWSLAELWANNEFPVVSSDIKPLTLWRSHELPYILNTGKQDFRQKVIEPVEFNKKAIQNAKDEQERLINEDVEKLLKLNPPKTIKPSDVPNSRRFIEEVGPYTRYGFSATENALKTVDDIYKKNLMDPIKPMIFNETDTHGDTRRMLKYALCFSQYASETNTVDYFFRMFDLNFIDNFFPLSDFPNRDETTKYIKKESERRLQFLLSEDLINKKQFYGVLRQIKDIKNLEDFVKFLPKYFDEKSLLYKVKNNYFKSLPKARSKDAYFRKQQVPQYLAIENYEQRQRIRDSYPYNAFYTTPELKEEIDPTEFLQQNGVNPNYSILSPDGYRIYTTERILNPDPKYKGGTHYTIVGERGTKQLDVIGKYNADEFVSGNPHGGQLTKQLKNMSRNFGMLFPFMFLGLPTLKNNLESEKKHYQIGKESEKKPKSRYARAMYNMWDPMATYPSGMLDAVGKGLATLLKAAKNPDTKDWKPEIGNISKLGADVSDAAWRKRLGYSYDEKLLPVWNGDTVSLPKELEREIPIDTNMLKKRIENNKKLMAKYGRYRRDPFVQESVRVDSAALEALRKTYATGEPVGVNEQAFNSRHWVDNGNIIPTMSPLNVLKDYNLRYDKDSNDMYYSDEYNFNQFDFGVPGKSFRIRGAIDLDSLSTNYKYGKESGIHIKPSHRGRLTALKKRTGKSEAELYKNGSAAVRKMITFARNARKWKH